MNSETIRDGQEDMDEAALEAIFGIPNDASPVSPSEAHIEDIAEKITAVLPGPEEEHFNPAAILTALAKVSGMMLATVSEKSDYDSIHKKFLDTIEEEVAMTVVEAELLGLSPANDDSVDDTQEQAKAA